MPNVTGDRVVWAVVTCGAIVLAAEPPTIALLRRRRVLDVPGTRSSHSIATPRGGGAPIAVGLLAAAAVAVASGAVAAGLAFALAVAFFGLLGLVDDVRGLPALTRLALQTAGAAAVATLLVAWLSMPPLAVAVAACAAACWLVGLVNAVNFMDGVNGISGAHALIGGVVCACLAGCRPDGFGVAAGLALYLADVAWTLQRRVRRGERWLEPHRTHVYQRWCDAGWSHAEVTVLTSALTVTLCLLGLAGLLGGAEARAAADLAGLGVLSAYLGSPGLFARAGLDGAPGPGGVAWLVVAPYAAGRAEAISEMEKA
jgi:UDP-N-acetylmuramyl pentapeptide phosphotransferase/UDP-N-acetylglucosamine-1-phosphate transferase